MDDSNDMYCAVYKYEAKKHGMCSMGDLWLNDGKGELIQPVDVKALKKLLKTGDTCRLIDDEGKVVDKVVILQISNKKEEIKEYLRSSKRLRIPPKRSLGPIKGHVSDVQKLNKSTKSRVPSKKNLESSYRRKSAETRAVMRKGDAEILKKMRKPSLDDSSQRVSDQLSNDEQTDSDDSSQESESSIRSYRGGKFVLKPKQPEESPNEDESVEPRDDTGNDSGTPERTRSLPLDTPSTQFNRLPRGKFKNKGVRSRELSRMDSSDEESTQENSNITNPEGHESQPLGESEEVDLKESSSEGISQDSDSDNNSPPRVPARILERSPSQSSDDEEDFRTNDSENNNNHLLFTPESSTNSAGSVVSAKVLTTVPKRNSIQTLGSPSTLALNNMPVMPARDLLNKAEEQRSRSLMKKKNDIYAYDGESSVSDDENALDRYIRLRSKRQKSKEQVVQKETSHRSLSSFDEGPRSPSVAHAAASTVNSLNSRKSNQSPVKATERVSTSQAATMHGDGGRGKFHRNSSPANRSEKPPTQVVHQKQVVSGKRDEESASRDIPRAVLLEKIEKLEKEKKDLSRENAELKKKIAQYREDCSRQKLRMELSVDVLQTTVAEEFQKQTEKHEKHEKKFETNSEGQVAITPDFSLPYRTYVLMLQQSTLEKRVKFLTRLYWPEEKRINWYAEVTPETLAKNPDAVEMPTEELLAMRDIIAATQRVNFLPGTILVQKKKKKGEKGKPMEKKEVPWEEALTIYLRKKLNSDRWSMGKKLKQREDDLERGDDCDEDQVGGKRKNYNKDKCRAYEKKKKRVRKIDD